MVNPARRGVAFDRSCRDLKRWSLALWEPLGCGSGLIEGVFSEALAANSRWSLREYSPVSRAVVTGTFGVLGSPLR
jgi:hypothetical protein